MRDRIKQSFEQIQAEEALKESTKAFLMKKTHGYASVKKERHFYRLCTAVCMCFLLIAAGCGWVYYTPTAEISIDINPSIELKINRFDRVIAVSSYNKDGAALAEGLHVKHMNYYEALDQILASEGIALLLSEDEIMAITVTAKEEAQSAAIFSDVESCAAHHGNMYCYSMSSSEAEEAHKTGLSCGKYKALLELQRLDPSITPAAVQNMTMRQIRAWIDALSAESDTIEEESIDQENSSQACGQGECGHGHRYGRK